MAVDPQSSESRDPTGASLAAVAGERVRAIIEAAEASAAEIRRQAEVEADEIRRQAEVEADEIRSGASTQMHERMGRFAQAMRAMLERVEAMESELNTLFETLRAGANRLTAELQRLEATVGEARDPGEPRPPEHAAPEPGSQKLQGDALAEAQAAPAAPLPAASAGAPDDTEAARLVALNMALDQKSREETERYLAENFHVADLSGLLDDVYAAVDG